MGISAEFAEGSGFGSGFVLFFPQRASRAPMTTNTVRHPSTTPSVVSPADSPPVLLSSVLMIQYRNSYLMYTGRTVPPIGDVQLSVVSDRCFTGVVPDPSHLALSSYTTAVDPYILYHSELSKQHALTVTLTGQSRGSRERSSRRDKSSTNGRETTTIVLHFKLY